MPVNGSHMCGMIFHNFDPSVSQRHNSTQCKPLNCAIFSPPPIHVIKSLSQCALLRLSVATLRNTINPTMNLGGGENVKAMQKIQNVQHHEFYPVIVKKKPHNGG